MSTRNKWFVENSHAFSSCISVGFPGFFRVGPKHADGADDADNAGDAYMK